MTIGFPPRRRNSSTARRRRATDRGFGDQPGRDRLPGRKGPSAAKRYADLKSALADADHVLKEAPFSIDIVESMRGVERSAVPDMPDRIVAATALYFSVPVISRDGRIRTSLSFSLNASGKRGAVQTGLFTGPIPLWQEAGQPFASKCAGIAPIRQCASPS